MNRRGLWKTGHPDATMGVADSETTEAARMKTDRSTDRTWERVAWGAS